MKHPPAGAVGGAEHGRATTHIKPKLRCPGGGCVTTLTQRSGKGRTTGTKPKPGAARNRGRGRRQAAKAHREIVRISTVECSV